MRRRIRLVLLPDVREICLHTVTLYTHIDGIDTLTDERGRAFDIQKRGLDIGRIFFEV